MTALIVVIAALIFAFTYLLLDTAFDEEVEDEDE